MVDVDLNADVGEADRPGSDDAELMRWITSANVACGGHAGNVAVMASTVALAHRLGVAVGAHPGIPDRDHFGRREVAIAPQEAAQLVTEQVAALAAVADAQGVRLHHVKPHGALYNMAARDPVLARAIASAVASFDAGLILVGLSGSELITAGKAIGLRTAAEAFADRAYLADGSLASRTMPDSLLTDAAAVSRRAVAMVRTRQLLATDGTAVPLTVETLCVHGDTPGAPALARRLRQALEAAGISVRARR